MQEDVRKEFLPLESKPWWIITWLIWIFEILVIVAIFSLISILPFLLINSKIVLIIVAVIYYPMWMYGGYLFFRRFRKLKRKSVRKILVDDKGVHYIKFDGSTEEFLYSQLEKWSLDDAYDVDLSPQNKTWFLGIKYGGSIEKVDFRKIDPGFSYYAGNTQALRRKFIEGIAYFRPDLRMSPFIFDVFYIHPENFTFDRKNFWKTALEAIGLLLAGGTILGLIMLGIAKWLF